MSKYVRLTSLDYNNNRFNYFHKIYKYYFKLIRNREKQIYKTLAIFDKKKIIKSRQSLFYLRKN